MAGRCLGSEAADRDDPRGFDHCGVRVAGRRGSTCPIAGAVAQALTSVQEALQLQAEFSSDPPAADLGLVAGRALLLSGRSHEALEPLRQSYGFWLGLDPRSVWAAESEYWLGRAWIANGEAKRGRWMVSEARRALAKSPLPSHRRLAAIPDA